MSKYRLSILIILLFTATACKEQEKEIAQNHEKERIIMIDFNTDQAFKLSKLPLKCVQKEYPNKTGQVIGSKDDIGEPHELHPAFFGCFDWHSAVHGHWSLVRLLKFFPNLDNAESIKQVLKNNLSEENMNGELAYFEKEINKSFERTYGWAWFLKLSEEISTWEDEIAGDLEKSLKPLTELIVENYLEFLPKLQYPIRVGEHTNTAFGLSLAYDYALTKKDSSLIESIEFHSRKFYMDDMDCPLIWEPSGYDFLSPCLQEIDLMRKVLPKEQFIRWSKEFMPSLYDEHFELLPGIVSDREDGKLVHLDGLNFSRAWVLFALSKQYDEFDHLNSTAIEHMNYSFPNLVGDSYEGGHWLASFALYAIASQ